MLAVLIEYPRRKLCFLRNFALCTIGKRNRHESATLEDTHLFKCLYLLLSSGYCDPDTLCGELDSKGFVLVENKNAQDFRARLASDKCPEKIVFHIP